MIAGADLHAARAALLPRYDQRAPRYTSYPTAVQFSAEVDGAAYAHWLGALPLDPPVSLYVHVPFCAQLCWFCGCNTRVVRARETIGDYVGLVREELRLVREHLPGRLFANALHLGGGTPNTVSPIDLWILFHALRQAFQFTRDAEISVEIDPGQLSAEWVEAAAGLGVNRASLGIQDLSPDVQAAVNRHEPFEDVSSAVDMLRTAGIDALNFDLMYGLPRQRVADVLATLDRVLPLKPQRISLFGYAHVPWVKAHQRLIDERSLPGPAERLDQNQAAADRLAREGYVAVGLDHYALPDDPLAEGPVHRNFQGYTTDAAETLLGFGASAIGRLPQGFVQNQANEFTWRRSIEAGKLATARGAILTADDRFRGEIIARLMCDLQVDLDEVCRRHGRSLLSLEPALKRVSEHARDGVVRIDGGRLLITALGRPFVRSVCTAFDAYLEPAAARHSLAV